MTCRLSEEADTGNILGDSTYSRRRRRHASASSSLSCITHSSEVSAERWVQRSVERCGVRGVGAGGGVQGMAGRGQPDKQPCLPFPCTRSTHGHRAAHLACITQMDNRSAQSCPSLLRSIAQQPSQHSHAFAWLAGTTKRLDNAMSARRRGRAGTAAPDSGSATTTSAACAWHTTAGLRRTGTGSKRWDHIDMSCVVLMGLLCVRAHTCCMACICHRVADRVAPHANGSEWRRRCCEHDGMAYLVTENVAAGAGAARRAVELACCALRCIIIMLSKSLRSSGDGEQGATAYWACYEATGIWCSVWMAVVWRLCLATSGSLTTNVPNSYPVRTLLFLPFFLNARTVLPRRNLIGFKISAGRSKTQPLLC